MKNQPAHQKNSIDVGLSVLCAVAGTHETMTRADIAEVCGCSRTRIHQIELRALAKLRDSNTMERFRGWFDE